MKIITLDLGGTFIKAALMNEKAEILEQWKVPSPTDSFEKFEEALDSCVKPHLEGAEGIAMSMPGRIDVKKGIAHTAGAFSNIIFEFPMVEYLEKRYGVPAAIDNDGKCAANAENWIGALKDCNSGVVYVIGTGIGGGIVIDNKVYRGIDFSAGELSCCLLDIRGDMQFSNWAAMRLATPALLNDYKSAIGTDDKIDGIEFFTRLNNGDIVAQEILRNWAKMTANYFYNLQTVLDVERFAIGGGISAQPILLRYVQEEVDKIWMGKYGGMLPSSKPEIVLCQYGNDANLIGALQNFLELKKA